MLDVFLGLIAFIILVSILSSAIKVVREYERGVIFRLGRLIGAKGPGLFLIIPIVDKFIKIDLRVVAFDVPKQRVITKDNVSVDVDAAVYYRVFDPAKAVVQVEDYYRATNLLAQTTLRDVLGQVELDELLTKREELSKKVGEILDAYTDPWGIKVVAVAIKDVSMPETMLRAIAKQAEAEREKRSRIIVAEGEYIAAEKIAAAAKRYMESPLALRLRELQTLTEIAREKNLVVVTTTTEATDLGKLTAMVKAFQEKETK
ncbi:slipin family protein [Candidatus Bathyarchaeota archaeon]|nr:slipin family protein [Candidatus Bathyarchaeota archaeon]